MVAQTLESPMLKKQIPYSEISFTYPEIVQTEKSGEAKKYTLHSKSNNGS